ncbi:prostaglandin E2 receptor EP3 subtype [Oratosquilla oratoria]|uniref:prostaglandin E2 receptor EP3 subtype n=1 Tax=Oratosquilla oratoria TaxID=337810 RepID=UPI003F7588C2
MSNGTAEGAGPSSSVVRHLPVKVQFLVTCCYVFGITGNTVALYIITKNETMRYKKQTLLLRCLAWNDLVALVGSFVQMYMHLYLPVANSRWFCAFRVLWRAFGLGSGCIAFVMAVERWLALAHPFTYQKHVTYAVIRRSILVLWGLNALLICCPFVGFGLWYDERAVGPMPCVRYRNGTSLVDRIYAYVFFAFGAVMCLVIVMCNLTVIRALCRMGNRLVARRFSRASSRSSSSIENNGSSHATPEELSFARLMAVLSIFFVVCWAPQLITIIIAQVSEGGPSKMKSVIYRMADVLIALNFTLDPYVYVILRRHRLWNGRHFRKMMLALCPQRFNLPQASSPSHLPIGLCTSSSRGSQHSHATNQIDYDRKPTVSTSLTSSEKEYVPLKLLLEPSSSHNVPHDIPEPAPSDTGQKDSGGESLSTI